jgi:hypothetical protein
MPRPGTIALCVSSSSANQSAHSGHGRHDDVAQPVRQVEQPIRKIHRITSNPHQPAMAWTSFQMAETLKKARPDPTSGMNGRWRA